MSDHSLRLPHRQRIPSAPRHSPLHLAAPSSSTFSASILLQLLDAFVLSTAMWYDDVMLTQVVSSSSSSSSSSSLLLDYDASIRLSVTFLDTHASTNCCTIAYHNNNMSLHRICDIDVDHSHRQSLPTLSFRPIYPNRVPLSYIRPNVVRSDSSPTSMPNRRLVCMTLSPMHNHYHADRHRQSMIVVVLVAYQHYTNRLHNSIVFVYRRHDIDRYRPLVHNHHSQHNDHISCRIDSQFEDKMVRRRRIVSASSSYHQMHRHRQNIDECSSCFGFTWRRYECCQRTRNI